MTRRTFLAATGVGAATLTLGCGDNGNDPPPVDASPVGDAPVTPPDPYANLDTDSYLGQVTTLATIDDAEVFLEGPAYGPDGRVYFTNIPVSKILVFDPATAEVTEFRTDSNAANGMLFGPDGRLLICEGGELTGNPNTTGKGRVVALDIATGDLEVLADAYNGQDLQPPNDVTFDGAGRLYFSSRPNATDATDETQGTVNAMYRIDPDGTVVRLDAYPDVDKPNGVVTSPDYSKLYLIEAHGGEDKNRLIFSYDLDADGNVSNRQLLYDFYPGRSGDGMAIDSMGNLYVAAGLHETRGTSETLDTRPGIHVISPQGELLAFRETPIDSITNCTFGGADLKTLYITCGNLLLSMPTIIAGKSDYLVTSA